MITLWPRHAVNSLRRSPEIAEQSLKPFVLRNLLYWAEAVEVTDAEFMDYVAHGVENTPYLLLLDLFERLMSLLRSQSTEIAQSFQRSFVANHCVFNICTKKAAVLYGSKVLLCFNSHFARESTREFLFRWKSFVSCPALLQNGITTLLACIRSSETHLQIWTGKRDNLIYEASVERRVVEMVAIGPHLVVVYYDGSMEQFSLSKDLSIGGGGLKNGSEDDVYDAWDDDKSGFWPDDSYEWPEVNQSEEARHEYEARRHQEPLCRAPISLSVEVVDCNYVKRITAVNPITSAVALTFNCGADVHKLVSPSDRHSSVSLGGELVYWNCDTKTGHSLKLPSRASPVSHMLFNRTQGMVEGVEHLAAVTAAGSVFVWRFEGTESSLVGKFDPPKELTLPHLLAFEYYALERPALELFSFKWEDGTVALYEPGERCSLLHWVRAKSALRVPWGSLDVEEMNPEVVDPHELQPRQSLPEFTAIIFDVTDLIGTHSTWIIIALLVYGFVATLYILFGV